MTTSPQTGLAQRALVLAETGRHKQAAALFARHLAGDPTDTMSWSLLAHCRRELGDPEGALDATDQGLRHDPTDAYVWRMRALTLQTLERHQDAVDAAAEAVRLAPGGWATHNTYARTLAAVPGGLPAAGAAAARAAALAPQEPQAHFWVGYIAHQAGDHEAAARAYRTVLNLNPQDAAARNNLGVLKLRGGRQFGAAQDFAASLAADPQSSAAHQNVLTVAVRVLVTARRLALWCLFGAAAVRWYIDGPGRTGPLSSLALPAWASALPPWTTGLAAIVIIWTLWAWSTRRRLPGALRMPMWAMLVRDVCFATSGFGIIVALGVAFAILAPPHLPRLSLALMVMGGIVPLAMAPTRPRRNSSTQGQRRAGARR
ncbi:tetratricopeptide repeat protein [Streptomyces griseorubiginosus]|uniref:tetratricopeptide repeat protein n=1 Tax=Streptomyces griseorubiginosus TaxID=67304 RepID=UPI0036E0EAA0